jgi:hypothetical protein
MRRDDYKFLAGLLATVLLLVAVVYSSYRRDLSAAAGPTIDLKRIETMMQQGTLSNHEASWWEVDKGEGQ